MTFDILTDGPSVLNSNPSELDKWADEAFHVRVGSFGKKLLCYSPTAYPYEIADHRPRHSDNFVSLSVTGTSCSLGCEHCKGRLLTGMEPTLTPDSLYERCLRVAEAGGEGVLISGGSDSAGHVPLLRFGEIIKRVKTELELAVVVHTGLVDRETAASLAAAGIDAAMLDVIGDAELSEEVYHIPDGPRKMRESLDILEGQGIPTVPHVLVGLDYGSLKGEIEALDMISQGTPSALVIIALSPVRRTPMEGILPPTPEEIGRVMVCARLGMKRVPLLLGCARPLGPHKIETDRHAISAGANGIALISQEGVDHGRSRGLEPVFRDVCCSLAYQAIE